MEFDRKETAQEIFDMAKTIYKMIEENNPEVIGERCDEDYTKFLYYFDAHKIDGAIVKEVSYTGESVFYYITSTIHYINSEGKEWAFAKVRIFEDRFSNDIQIWGNRTGSCFSHDWEDHNFLENPDFELPLVLNQMKESLSSIFEEIKIDPIVASNKNETAWVKKYRRENQFKTF